MKIEVDGVAMDVEPGKKYIIVYDRAMLGSMHMQNFQQVLREKWGVDTLIIRSNISPKDALRIIKVEEPEHAQ